MSQNQKILAVLLQLDLAMAEVAADAMASYNADVDARAIVAGGKAIA